MKKERTNDLTFRSKKGEDITGAVLQGIGFVIWIIGALGGAIAFLTSSFSLLSLWSFLACFMSGSVFLGLGDIIRLLITGNDTLSRIEDNIYNPKNKDGHPDEERSGVEAKGVASPQMGGSTGFVFKNSEPQMQQDNQSNIPDSTAQIQTDSIPPQIDNEISPRFCANCGALIEEEDALFCRKCGARRIF